MTTFRIATFNLENLDETGDPSLAERVALMRPQIIRLRADVACFQEVNGQERPGQPRQLFALAELLTDTNLEGAPMVSTHPENDAAYNERNLVVVTHLPVVAEQQIQNKLIAKPQYMRLTANPPDTKPVEITVERPLLHVTLDLSQFGGGQLHVINVHLKSRIPTDIPGQKIDSYTWRTADSYAEGAFISSMKRMSQAVEARRLVDQILDADPNAQIITLGDFNATPEDIPVLALRGNVEDTGNGELANRVLVPVEQTVPASARYTLIHQGTGQMLDHMLITRNLLAHYRGSEIHNEILHDESVAFGTDRKYPESDHAPVVATFQFD